MTTPTISPRDLYTPILVSISMLTGKTADQAVSRKEVLGMVIEALGLPESDPLGCCPKGRCYFSMYTSKAMYELKKGGLARSPKRGQWSITRSGLIEIGQAVFDPAEVVMKVDETPEDSGTPEVMEEIAEVSEVSEVVSEFTAPEIPAWARDPYIVSLMEASTPCFGNYSERSNACKVCPLVESCVSKTYEGFLSLVNSLPPGMIAFPESTEAPAPAPETSPVYDPSSTIVTFRASADCKCSLTGVTINKNENVAFLKSHGIVTVSAAKEFLNQGAGA